jgi:hypothetical protein
VRGEHALRVGRRLRRIACAAEDDEDGVALGPELQTARGLEGLAQQAAVLTEDVCVGISKLLEQPRRPLDVCEEEADGAPRQLRHGFDSALAGDSTPVRTKTARPRLLVALALLAALAAGCGGSSGAGGTLPAGARIVPASAPVFISIDTDFSSEQVKQALALVRRFPSGPKLLRESHDGISFARDVKPTLGPELDVVFVDFENGGDDYVGLMQPKDEAKFIRVLASGDEPAVHEKIDGWTVFAETQAVLERFKRARSASGDRLADEKHFEDALAKLPEDAVARAYVDGKAVQTELDSALAASDAPPGISRRFGTFNALAAAATARDDGARIDGFADLRLTPELPNFTPKLPEELPAGALLYYSFGHLDALFRQILREVERARPDARDQLKQVETVLGLTLANDIFPLFAGEGAFAVYRGSPLPTFELVLAGVDQQKTERLLAAVGAIAQLGGIDVSSVTIAGVQARKLDLPGQSFSIFYATFDGKLVVTNTRAGIAGLRRGGPKLADDPLYKEALAAADVPEQTTLLQYANLKSGLPVAFAFAERSGSNVSQEARANTRPLRSTVEYVAQEGDGYRIGGFVGIR